MFLIAPLGIAAAPAIISGISSFFGGRQTNKVNQREAQRNRQFQSDQAAVDRGFQERMSNTEWQRGVNDMIAAGINPAVAYARGGASAPSGAMAGGSQAAPATDAIGSGVSSAMAMLAQRKQFEMMDATIDKTKMEADKVNMEADVAANEARMSNARLAYYFEGNKPTAALQKLLDAEFNQSQASSARSVSDAQMAAFSLPEQQAIARLFETVGSGGKGMQMILPLLNTLISRRR